MTPGKLNLIERAKCVQRIAELHSRLAHENSRLAEIDRAIAGGEPVDVGTGRKARRAPEPEIPPPTELDAERARRSLQSGRRARRVRP